MSNSPMRSLKSVLLVSPLCSFPNDKGKTLSPCSGAEGRRNPRKRTKVFLHGVVLVVRKVVSGVCVRSSPARSMGACTAAWGMLMEVGVEQDGV